MKKILVLVALSMASALSFAHGQAAIVEYEYGRAEGNPYAAEHTLFTGIEYEFKNHKLGGVDAGFVVSQDVEGVRSNSVGYRIGYGNDTTVGKITLSGHVAFQNVNFNGLSEKSTDSNYIEGSLFDGKTKTWKYLVGLSMPIAQRTSAFVEVEHSRAHTSGRGTDFSVDNGVGEVSTGYVDSRSIENRYSVGLKTALTDNLSVKASFARIRSEGRDGNGLATEFSYDF